MSKLILVVDDEPKNLKLVRDLLHYNKYSTIVATDGEQAVAAARRDKPDLILMDIQMPVLDGLSAARILKSDPATVQIPIVALTSLAMTGDREEAMRAGCNDYMTKPLNTREFVRKLGEWLP